MKRQYNLGSRVCVNNIVSQLSHFCKKYNLNPEIVISDLNKGVHINRIFNHNIKSGAAKTSKYYHETRNI